MNDRSRLLLGSPKTKAKTDVPEANEKLLGKVRKELGISKEEFLHDDTVRRFVMREYHARRNASVRKSRNDIGELPAVAHPERRERCRLDLKAFIEEYFREEGKFDLPWSSAHLEAMKRMEQSVLNGGKYALAMSRGSGKTAITERCALWAVLYGHRRFVLFVGDGKAASSEALETIRTEVETNDRLFEDFPETCVPVRKLGGLALRANTQEYHGESTHLHWGGSERIVLPTIPGSPSSGCILMCAGINSRMRGLKFTSASGAEVRPDFFIADDIQSDRSAASPSQCAKRLSMLKGTIPGLAGPGRKMAGFLACTVIRKGDVADVLLDRKLSPDWYGTRFRLMESMPVNTELWDEYRSIWQDCQERGEGIGKATEFYRNHRREMDEGALPVWPERYEVDEISAVQYAMNLMFKDKASFLCEYQNDPPSADGEEDANLKDAEVYHQVCGLARRVVPLECDRLAIAVDVQKKILIWSAVAGSTATGRCHLCDYGVWPKSRSNYWTLDTIPESGSYCRPGSSFEGQLYEALAGLSEEFSKMEFVREDGVRLVPERILVDAAWGLSTTTVCQFCREVGGGWFPSFGRSITAEKKPFHEYRRMPGQRIGETFLVSRRGKTNQLQFEVDTNLSKTRLRNRLRLSRGEPGSLTVFGRPENAIAHKVLADQLCSEYSVTTTGKYRDVCVWSLRPGASDNHLLDTTSNALAALEDLGVGLGLQKREVKKSKHQSVHLPRKA